MDIPVPPKSKVMLSYQSIVTSYRSTMIRYVVAFLGLPFIKSIIRFFPGIDEAVAKSRDGKHFNVELVPSFLGMFTSHWEIRQRSVEAFVALGANVRAMHAPYVDDGKSFQPSRKSYFDNILDITKQSSKTLFCLYSHINLFELITPPEEDKVLIVHPLPSDPYMSELEIISGISKTVKKVLPMLREHNIRLVIENLPWMKKKHERYTTFMGDPLFFEKLMNEVSDPYYGVIFDWGHANSFARYMFSHGISHPEFTFTPETLLRFDYQQYFIERLQDKIFYAHLNFNEAHNLEANPPFFFPNFDTHGDLTLLTEDEYAYYKKNVVTLNKLPHLVGMTIESIPSFFNGRKRIQKYNDSVEILESMLQSPDNTVIK